MSSDSRKPRDEPERKALSSIQTALELSAAGEVSWDAVAAECRALTRERSHTPSEQLLRESRDER